jgi:PadR family transcriptional regulator
MTMATKAVVRAIKQLVDEGEEIYGYEISQRSDIRSGVVYPILKRLVDSGYLTVQWGPAENGARRRIYEVTDQWPALVHKVQARTLHI